MGGMEIATEIEDGGAPRVREHGRWREAMRNSMAVVSGGVCFLFLDQGRVRQRFSLGHLLVLGQYATPEL